MAFFSFSLFDESFCYLSEKIKSKITYYSKDITLWKNLTNKNSKIKLISIKHEKRIKLNSLGKRILICLPPKFGLGDAVEYGISINSLISSNKFSKVGIAFTGDKTLIFTNFFLFKYLYPYIISSQDISNYDTIFHITLEIEDLKFQKYRRTDIVSSFCNYFKILAIDFKINKLTDKKIKNQKISIFPVSTSLIRCMPFRVVDCIIENFKNICEIEVYLDDSEFSSYLEGLILDKNIVIKKPTNIERLIEEISFISLGIFIDSGPLHIAKIFDKTGVFIETSVSNKILLEKNFNFIPVLNRYESPFCKGPCGLVDIFSYKNKVGCYETNMISFDDIRSLKNLKATQRRSKKENNKHFLLNPVGCIKKIDIDMIIKSIKLKMKENL